MAALDCIHGLPPSECSLCRRHSDPAVDAISLAEQERDSSVDIRTARPHWTVEIRQSLKAQEGGGRWNKTRAVFGSPEGENVTLGDDFLGDPGEDGSQTGGA